MVYCILYNGSGLVMSDLHMHHHTAFVMCNTTCVENLDPGHLCIIYVCYRYHIHLLKCAGMLLPLQTMLRDYSNNTIVDGM